MVGRELKENVANKNIVIDNPILEIKNLSKKNLFKDINFKLNNKEVLGFYGLVGSGRSEVMKSIFSINNVNKGSLFLDKIQYNFSNPIDAINKGIVYLTEERNDLGIINNMSITDNLTLSILKNISAYGILDIQKQVEVSNDLKKKLNIKFSSTNENIDNISGGNQQKIVIGKWLSTNPRIIILDEPTKGIDVGSKETIHEFMKKLVSNGMSIILVSSDLTEIMGLCNRVVVMEKGLIKKTLNISETSSEEILSYAAG